MWALDARRVVEGQASPVTSPSMFKWLTDEKDSVWVQTILFNGAVSIIIVETSDKETIQN